MKLKTLFFSFFIILMIAACNNNTAVKEKKKIKFNKSDYSVEVIDEKQIPVSSGSGITGFNHGFLVVGDDSPWLFYMDSTGVITDSLRLSHEEGYAPGMRMPGLLKPDFETITMLDENRALIISSGSSNEARDTSYLVDVDNKAIILHRSMGDLFEALAESAGIDDRHELNIEGSTLVKNSLYLFNRGDFSEKNLVFKLDADDFISYFTGQTNALPRFETTRIILPEDEDDNEMTFSAAFYAKKYKTFAFTATSEVGGMLGADGKVIDGDISGTSIGFIPMAKLTTKHEIAYRPIMRDGLVLPVKIEGLWPLRKLDKRSILFYAVSDPDDGTTVLYSIKIKFKEPI